MADPIEDLSALLPPLLRALEALGLIARYFNPGDLPGLLAAVGEPEAEVRTAQGRISDWPAGLADVRAAVETASAEVTAGFEALRGSGSDPGQVHRGLRALPRAEAALYPLAAGLPPVSRFFLRPEARGDAALLARLAEGAAREDTGVIHDGAPGERGGASLYVPEYYDDGRAWPLVVALHGGAGNGRSFLWSWLSDARSFGAIVVAPTAIGETWALTGVDADTPNLARLVSEVGRRWRIDPRRVLLTGMSDGGTFTYVSGLEPGSPFTHLAPIAAAFHPMLAAMADPNRLADLPIHIAHGALDWMFPAQMAREARDTLAAAGAAVTYRELPDLAHAYPRELNREILAWMGVTVA